MSFYETERAVAEYLLFHYGSAADVLPWAEGPQGALGFPGRCAGFFEQDKRMARALDIGCAVGRSTFELARFSDEVVGIDYSHAFVAAAERMRREGAVEVEVAEEGTILKRVSLTRPAGIDSGALRFEQGDAHALPEALGLFDAVLAANLIDRLARPRLFLERLPSLVRSGGQLVLTSPYTWTEEYTTRAEWLGGFVRDGKPVRTRETLEEALAPHFTLETRTDLHFLIREHGRKFQWSVAEATRWRRR